MPRLESQLNHGEIKLKLELYIKYWKKRSSAENKQETLEISQGLRNFVSHVKFCATPTKFRKATNFHSTYEFGCSCC